MGIFLEQNKKITAVERKTEKKRNLLQAGVIKEKLKASTVTCERNNMS